MAGKGIGPGAQDKLRARDMSHLEPLVCFFLSPSSLRTLFSLLSFISWIMIMIHFFSLDPLFYAYLLLNTFRAHICK